MKPNEIEINKRYLFDKHNVLGQRETDIAVVEVVGISKHFFKRTFTCKPITTTVSRLFKPEERFMVEDSNLFDELKPEDNIIIRYPSDIPVFNSNDMIILDKMANLVTNDPDIGANFTASELACILSLVNKVHFYSKRPEL